MRYSTFFKFVAVVLCAASLLGMAGGAAGIFFLTELEGRSVESAYIEQLSSRSMGYTLDAGLYYVSEHLGGAPRNLINNYIGNDWENRYFNWTRMGYALSDSEGNVVSERPLPDNSQDVEYQFENAVSGRYMKVINTYPPEEKKPQPLEPAERAPQVLVMPMPEGVVVGEVYVEYTDGHREEWPADGTQLGALYYDGGESLTFRSNIGEFPMGDGWYPNHIVMMDIGGNVVYEVNGDSNVILGSELDEYGVCNIHLPADTVTTRGSIGMTVTSGDYKAYDAIPEQGVTVATMNVTYANAQGETMGSEGISSPDLIGTIFHTPDFNVEFRSKDPMSMDISEDCIITDITFAGVKQNCVFEASCPGGVGVIEYTRDGHMIFKGRIPGTEVGESPAETEGTGEGQPGFVMEQLTVYAAPSIQSAILETLEAWQEITILRQDSFAGESWGLTERGWVLMDQVLLAETSNAFIMPRMETVETFDTEPTQPTEETVSEEVLPAQEQYSAEAVETGIYYDTGLQREMVAEYVWELIPEGYTMTICLARGAIRDEFVWALIRVAENFRHMLVEILGISIAVFALCIVHLSCSAGRTRRNHEVRAGGLNRIPLDLYLAGDCCIGVGLVFLIVEGTEYLARSDEQLALILLGASAYFLALLLVGYFFAVVAQFKTPGGYWWRNTLCGRCMKLTIRGCTGAAHLGIKGWKQGTPLVKKASLGLWSCGKAVVLWMWDTAKRLIRWAVVMAGKGMRWTTAKLGRFFGMLPITWQFLTTGFTMVLLLYVMMRTYKVGYILLGFGMFFAVVLYAASAFAILLESAKRMSKGDLDTKVDDRMLIGGFKEFAEKLNDLAGVAVIAAQKQLKSERMKTELITNVSHDIKTPLTSIINYVDLLQKPHTEQQQEQYLEVIDRQSHRLKKLVDDLMEMSKASTGNMTVEIQRMDAGETVNQALGEFADKLERAQLIPVFRQPDDPVYMMADGRLVWRVMSNVLGNTVKYALPGTRVYLDLLEMDGKVIISVKNISREELNVHADELLERFVRGDASRNTEGSGLGLNIAQSLMELQKGQLRILVDGDLFKVTLIFPKA